MYLMCVWFCDDDENLDFGSFGLYLNFVCIYVVGYVATDIDFE